MAFFANLFDETKRKMKRDPRFRSRDDYYTVQRADSATLIGYKRDAERGKAKAQCFLGIMYQLGLGGLSPDIDKAIFWFQKAAKNGYSSKRTINYTISKLIKWREENQKLTQQYDGTNQQAKCPRCGSYLMTSLVPGYISLKRESTYEHLANEEMIGSGCVIEDGEIHENPDGTTTIIVPEDFLCRICKHRFQ